MQRNEIQVEARDLEKEAAPDEYAVVPAKK
jgi:hypothetical protein